MSVCQQRTRGKNTLASGHRFLSRVLEIHCNNRQVSRYQQNPKCLEIHCNNRQVSRYQQNPKCLVVLAPLAPNGLPNGLRDHLPDLLALPLLKKEKIKNLTHP